jgi:hypothetical protein
MRLGTTVQQKELAEENHNRLCKIEKSQDEIRQNVEGNVLLLMF